MYIPLGACRLRDAAELEIGVVTAPDDVFRDPVLALLSHKIPYWDEHLRAAMDNQCDLLETRWYLGRIDGAVVANIMTVERHGLGILGHVYTKPEHRRRGIIRRVMARQMQDFANRDGRSLLLGTGYPSVPYDIYASFGFISLRGGFMRWDNPTLTNWQTAWYAEGPAEVSEARWEHWPLAAHLAAAPGVPGLRSANWGVWDIGNLEGPYCHLMHHRAVGTGSGVVAQSPAGAVVALATCVPFRLGEAKEPWPAVWLVDAFAQAHHGYKLAALLDVLPKPEGKLIAFAATDDTAKCAALSAAGFAREGVWRSIQQSSGPPADMATYGRVCETALP